MSWHVVGLETEKESGEKTGGSRDEDVDLFKRMDRVKNIEDITNAFQVVFYLIHTVTV